MGVELEPNIEQTEFSRKLFLLGLVGVVAGVPLAKISNDVGSEYYIVESKKSEKIDERVQLLEDQIAKESRIKAQRSSSQAVAAANAIIAKDENLINDRSNTMDSAFSSYLPEVGFMTGVIMTTFGGVGISSNIKALIKSIFYKHKSNERLKIVQDVVDSKMAAKAPKKFTVIK
ncbi:MAG TPA: hypothetical protein VMR41_00390 [Patescibacteria group bacterium]|nr:hypothetical protein [Patescibacteria group bacterium]